MESQQDCEYYTWLISRFLDGLLSPNEHRVLFRHLGQCPVCGTRLTRYREAEQQLRSLETPQLRTGLRERIRQAMPSSLPAAVPPNRIRLTRGQFSLLASTVVVVLVAVAWLFHPFAPDWGDVEQARHTVTTRALVQALPAEDPTREPAPGESLEPAGRQFVLAAVNDTLVRNNTRLPLHGLLPEGSSVERVLLENAKAPSRAARVEVVFISPQGYTLRLENTPEQLLQSRPRELVAEGHLTIDRQDWWYGHVRDNNTEEPAQVLFTVDSGNILSLEGGASISELIQVIKSLQ
jgi:hypothetical protein